MCVLLLHTTPTDCITDLCYLPAIYICFLCCRIPFTDFTITSAAKAPMLQLEESPQSSFLHSMTCVYKVWDETNEGEKVLLIDPSAFLYMWDNYPALHNHRNLPDRSRTLLSDENSSCPHILCWSSPFLIIDPSCLILGSLPSWQGDRETLHGLFQSVALVLGIDFNHQ